MSDVAGPSRLEMAVMGSSSEFEGQPMTRDLQRRIMERIVTALHAARAATR